MTEQNKEVNADGKPASANHVVYLASGVRRPCYTHGGYYLTADGEDGCVHSYCVGLRTYAEKHPPQQPLFSIGWLRQSNAAGETAYGMLREMHETAERDGREIERAR